MHPRAAGIGAVRVGLMWEPPIWDARVRAWERLLSSGARDRTRARKLSGLAYLIDVETFFTRITVSTGDVVRSLQGLSTLVSRSGAVQRTRKRGAAKSQQTLRALARSADSGRKGPSCESACETFLAADLALLRLC